MHLLPIYTGISNQQPYLYKANKIFLHEQTHKGIGSQSRT